MTRDEAYKHLGLTPLDEFLAAREDQADRLGATTWMLVTAALTAIQGKEITVVGHDLPYAESLAGDCLSFINKLVPGTHVHQRTRGRSWSLDIPNGRYLHWQSYRTLPKFLAGQKNNLVFRDDVWAQRARLRVAGPYASIRVIRRTIENGEYHYRAYDGLQEFLLELDPKGAEDIVNADPYRVAREGW